MLRMHPRHDLTGLGRASAGQPFAPAGDVVVLNFSTWLAFCANSLVKVLPIVTFETSVPINFSIAYTVFGPPAGMMPEHRYAPA